ncbi:MAG TPA: VOC family protein, partial [Inquilinus sp.]
LERRKPAAERTGPLLPERARCLGVEFVEFAVDEAGAIELEALFAGLGFARRGRHRSKDVILWSQGDINLLVNREKEGYAHAAYIMHGPAACAICLKVDDAGAATARAGALLATGFRQEVEPGELEIPAIRGVGGSLIYLVDSGSELARWREVDFVAVEDPAPEAGLARIDHLSQSMQYDEMLSWLLFYSAIFDLAKTPELEIPDPAGLVRSQVVQNAEGTLRLVLNASQSHRTLSARFLSEFFGSGIQHIALETGDIFAAAARMRQAGVKFLPIPANYYDDIEARFGLEPDLLDRLREAGILYDRDGSGGEFFQLYTTSFADRFFFEIVQRRFYAGFGAANAPIRLAAQTRLAPDVTMPRI